MADWTDILPKIGMFLIPFLFALCVHEYAHGLVASWLGDNTARLMGRLTLNPFAHANLVGTFILPILALLTGMPFFGWANPVPVNSNNLKNPRTGMFWVALAGPGSNVIMALLAAVIFGVTIRFFEEAQFSRAIVDFAKTFLMINLSLAYFNMIPIHPLDGGKIFAIFLPESLNQKLEEHQFWMSWLLLILFLSGPLTELLFRPVLWAGQGMLQGSLRLFGVAF